MRGGGMNKIIYLAAARMGIKISGSYDLIKINWREKVEER
jgi:hypothetical protein